MKYFELKELLHSDTATICRIDNTPTWAAVDNLRALVENVLDPLREAYGKPIHVTSGYRSPDLNRQVGGAPNSDHLTGKAADIVGTPNNRTENRKLFMLLSELKLPYKQLIDEQDYKWLHISYDRENPKQQVLHLK